MVQLVRICSAGDQGSIPGWEDEFRENGSQRAIEVGNRVHRSLQLPKQVMEAPCLSLVVVELERSE